MSNPDTLRLGGALLISLLAHGLFLGLAVKPGREKLPALSGHKVVMRLSARRRGMAPPPEPNRPKRLATGRAASLARPEPVRINAPAPGPPPLPAAEVIVRELPRPALPQSEIETGNFGAVAQNISVVEKKAPFLAASPETGTERPPEFRARPLYRRNPSPEYPSLARRRQWQGTVILEVLVDAEGAPRQIEVQESSGHRVLDQAALQAVRNWLFEPGRRGGVPVAMKVLVPVRFGLE